VPRSRIHTALESELYWASCHDARRALGGFASDDSQERRLASIAVGAAAENLLSSVVVFIDPVLLAEPNDVASAVALSRVNISSPLSLRTLRTGTWGRQLSIVQAVYPTVSIRDDIRSLLEIRNAAAHAALTDRDQLAEAVVRLVRVVDAILPLLPHRTPVSYWTDRLSGVVSELRDQRSNETARRVAAKLATARALVEARVAAMLGNEAALELFLATLESVTTPWTVADATEESKTCPACGRIGELSYVKIRDEVAQSETNFDRDGFPENVFYFVGVTGVPTLFQCPVCELQLEGEELAAFAELRDEVHLDSEEVDDPGYGYEPDEDELRGR
jgi:hypothetical protein